MINEEILGLVIKHEIVDLDATYSRCILCELVS